ncbi:hypothetical protein [Thiorhodococcus fuscus]|uniref:Uncharacterized protein n=1 Tax=Thiorhodococcus fuscus TaxID=527200 RepID=A0ABW4Y9Y4_9GAMM
MWVLEPLGVDTGADILAISVPGDDAYPAWSASVRYPAGSVVTTGADETLQIWEARYGSVAPISSGSALPDLYNDSIDPAGVNTIGRDNAGDLVDSATAYQHFGERWWRDATNDGYLANRFKMFDTNPSNITRSSSDILFDIRPQGAWSGIALFNVNADEIAIELIDGPSAYSAARTLRYPVILSASFPNEPQVAFVDIPEVDPRLYPDALLRVRIWATAPRWIHVGCVLIGPATQIGTAVYDLKSDLMDFSRFTRDPVFGDITAIPRGYSDKTTFPHVIPADAVGQARQLLVSRRAELTAYIGSPDVALSITYGYFVDLELPVDGASMSDASVVVESVLYDTPANAEDLPLRAVFVTPDGTACLESTTQVAERCLVDGKPDGDIYVTVLDYALEPGETIDWEMTWLKGSSANAHEITTLATDCGQNLSLLHWPVSPVQDQEEAIAAIRATITHVDTTTTTTAAAVLTVGVCTGGGDCDCTPVIEGAGFYNEWDGEEYWDYDYTSATLTGTTQVQELVEGAISISGAADSRKWFYVDLRGSGGLSVYKINVALSGGWGNPDIYAGYGWPSVEGGAEHYVLGSEPTSLHLNRNFDHDVFFIMLYGVSEYDGVSLELDLVWGIGMG